MDLNHQPTDYESAALTVELQERCGLLDSNQGHADLQSDALPSELRPRWRRRGAYMGSMGKCVLHVTASSPVPESNRCGRLGRPMPDRWANGTMAGVSAPAGLGNHERIHRPWTREAAYGNRTRVSGLGSPRSAIGPMRHEVRGWNRTSDALPCPAAPESAGGSALPLSYPDRGVDV